MRRVETLHTVEQALQVIRSLWFEIKTALQTGERLVVEVRHSTRSLEQNKRMWAMLTDNPKTQGYDETNVAIENVLRDHFVRLTLVS